MNKIDSAGDIGVYDVPRLLKRLIEECFAKSASGIGQQGRDRPPANLVVELIDPLDGGEVCLDTFHNATLASQFIGRSFNLRLARRDEQIKFVFCAFPCEFEPNS